MSRSNSDIVRVMQVPTIRPPQKQQPKKIIVNLLNEDELKLLKKRDPFLYYSIPAAKRAAKLTNYKPIDHTEVIREVARSSGSGMISRKTRVSTECAPSMLLDDLILYERRNHSKQDDIGDLHT